MATKAELAQQLEFTEYLNKELREKVRELELTIYENNWRAKFYDLQDTHKDLQKAYKELKEENEEMEDEIHELRLDHEIDVRRIDECWKRLAVAS